MYYFHKRSSVAWDFVSSESGVPSENGVSSVMDWSSVSNYKVVFRIITWCFEL